MVRVEIKNFQSITHQVIDVDGFSALAGRSNIGKSAVIRAIKAALTGSPADNYVRHSISCPRVIKGAKSCKCFCSVHIKAEGLDLLWEKGDAVNRYVHNGTEHTVVGRGTPDFLTPGFSPVKLGEKEKGLLQVSDQFKPIFILDKPGTVAADILSDVAKLDQINVAIRLAEKDRKEARATRKVREKDIEDLSEALEGYEGLDGVAGQASDVEEVYQQVEAIKEKAEQLEQFIEAIFSVGQQLRDLKAVEQIKVPDISPLKEEDSKFTTLERLVAELHGKAQAVLALKGLEAIEIPEMESFSSSGVLYEKLVQWASKVDVLASFLDKIQKLLLLSLPEFGPLEETRDVYLRIVLWATQAYELSQALLQLKQELKGTLQEEAEILQEFDSLGMLCRECNRPLTLDDH